MEAISERRGRGLALRFALVLFSLQLLFLAAAGVGGLASGAGGLASGDGFASSAPAVVQLPASLDALLLTLMVCLLAWLRLPGEKILLPALAALGLFLLVFRAADTLVPRFFNRPFVLHSDISYVPDLYALLRDTTSRWLFYPGLVLLVVLAAGLGYGLVRALSLLYWAFAGAAYRYAVLGAAAGLAVLALLGVVGPAQASTIPRVIEEFGALARRSAYLEEQRAYFEARSLESETLAGAGTGAVVGSGPHASARTDAGSAAAVVGGPGAGPEAALSPGVVPGETGAGPLDRLEGRNVLLFIVESYGYTLYGEPQHFEPIESDLRRYQAALERGGYAIVSNFLTSTAFGGNSWLADSTLTTGVKIDNQAAFELLLESELKPMAWYFNQAGYRTVTAMPAMTSAWPEGDFFAFDKKYHFRDFGYRGPNLKWAPMTDQYVLEVIHRREVSVAERPLFVQYVLISSHYPFNLIPRYFEDWSLLGDGTIYSREDAVTVLPIKPGNRTAGAEGYVASMRYELELITEYVTRLLAEEDRSLIVVVGDHQPYSGITGKGKPWSVPIHVLSRDPGTLQPFVERGYTPGWIPRQPLPHPGMESFLPGFLEDFSSGSAAAVAVSDPGDS